MLAGHIDEIGIMVNYITPEGFIAFKAIGGVDAAILPGMRVDVHTKQAACSAACIGRMPIHLSTRTSARPSPRSRSSSSTSACRPTR